MHQRQHDQQQQQLVQQHQPQTFYPLTYYTANGTLNARSRSVPEGLGCAAYHKHDSTNYRPQVHVVEQMTTSV